MYPVNRVLLVLILLLAGSVSGTKGVTATDSAISLNERVADHVAGEAAVAGELALVPSGELDPTFGIGGKSLIDLGGEDLGNDMVLQPDGKIVVAGASLVARIYYEFAVARVLVPQGTLDPAYGPLGTGRSLINLAEGSDFGEAVALQPDGKIIVAGGSGLNFAVARLLVPQGTLDFSYGSPSGWSNVDLGGAEGAKAVALQPDGKIVLAGQRGSDMAVARLLVPQGTLDFSYGSASGWSKLDFGGNEAAEAVALQPDGKIVVAGASNAKGTYDVAVARLLEPEGSFDTSFGEENGISLTDFGGADIALDMALQPDGKIVVAGYSIDATEKRSFIVGRLHPNGSLDTTFGNGGKSVVDFGGDDSGAGLALQRDGKIVVAGRSGGNFAVARLQPNGSPDTTFGTAGKSIVDFDGDDGGTAVALQPDGKIVVAGRSDANGTRDFAVARLEGDPGGGPVGGPGGGGPGGGGPPICGGKPATIIGTEAGDTLTGTTQKDVIAGLGGNDVLRGLGGNDLICGGAGKDRMVGGRGSDRLTGNAGGDRLVGGPGADNLNGGKGRDRCNGGPGADKLRSCEGLVG